MRLRVTISKTSTGDGDYIQVMADDMVSLNFTAVAESIEVTDFRKRQRGEAR